MRSIGTGGARQIPASTAASCTRSTDHRHVAGVQLDHLGAAEVLHETVLFLRRHDHIAREAHPHAA